MTTSEETTMTTTTTTTPGPGSGQLRRTRRGPLAALGVALALGLAVAGCTSDDDEPGGPGTTDAGTATTTPAPTGPASPTPSDEPTGTPAPTAPPADEDTLDAAPFPADTSPDVAEPSADAMLTVVDVRTAGHDGYDRVVYEMGGTGTPGWTVEYVDEAVQAGSGTVLDLPGDGTLSVLLTGSAYPMDSGVEPFPGPGAVTAADTQVVTEVQGWAVFEGVTDSHIGLTDAGHPFRVQLLEDPVRVVVDVAHGDA